jgi:putative aldouronate transport system permease protein
MIVFSYIPMVGILMAFQKYQPKKGIFGSTFIGLDNFIRIFSANKIGQVMVNTVFIASMKIAAGLLASLVFALLLNELRNRRFVRVTQTMVYLPYFLSWVILSGILIEILSPSAGIVNLVLKGIGVKPVYFLGNAALFPYVLVATDTWKTFGYGTIVYLAALTGIDPSLYEASRVDGANYIQQLVHITLPGITGIVILMSALSLGSLLNAGFDQVYNLINPQVYSTGEILDLTVYNLGIKQASFALATAVGLMKSIVSFILITISFRLAHRYAGYRIF